MTKSYAKTEAAVKERANPAALGSAGVKNPFTVLDVRSRKKTVLRITAMVKVNARSSANQVQILSVNVTVATMGRFVTNVDAMVFLKKSNQVKRNVSATKVGRGRNANGL